MDGKSGIEETTLNRERNKRWAALHNPDVLHGIGGVTTIDWIGLHGAYKKAVSFIRDIALLGSSCETPGCACIDGGDDGSCEMGDAIIFLRDELREELK